MTLSPGNWNYPNSIWAGIGRADELATACAQVGMRRPLLVTDPILSKMPMVQQAVDLCRQQFGECGLFDQVKGNPTGKNVDDGVDAFRAGGHDGVIAFGGGSAMDAGKAIAFISGQAHPLWDYEDNVKDNHLRVNVDGIAPIVAVPTTAGTGSEVGRASVITDEVARVKRTILHLKMMPRIAILDPKLTAGMPAGLTATTGADALTHCVEAFSSPVYHPMAAGIAMEGIRLIKANLKTVVKEGNDLDARQQMLVASSLGAAAFQRGLGGVHAIAQSLGALYDKHHGLLNAIILPYVLKANQPALNDVIEPLARFLDLPNPGFTAFLDWVLELRSEIGIPHTLAEIGLDDRDLELVGRMSFADGCSHTNPIPFTAEQYAGIFRSALYGA